MKKLLCFLIIAAMVLTSFAACSEPQTDTPNDSTGAQTSGKPTEGNDDDGNDGNADESTKVGDVLEAPEKTVDLEDLKDLTISASFSAPSIGPDRDLVYAVSNSDTGIRFYEKNVFKMAENQQDIMESICLPGSEGYLFYSRMGGSEFTPTNMTEQFGSNEGYFHYQLANFGIGYGDWLKTDGFTKCEDAKVLDRDCFVYEVSFTGKMGQTKQDAVICVDKETGLWLKMDVKVEGDTITRAISSIAYTATVFPGTQPVGMTEQVIYDANGIVIIAKALDFSNPNGAVLRLETKNSTGSDVKFTSHYFDINGLCMGGSVLSDTCPAGETKETELTLPNASLDLSGVEIVQSIEMALKLVNVHTETTPDGTFTVTDSILAETTEALTIKTQCPADYVQVVNKEGTVLIDTDEIYLVLCDFWVDESGWGYLKAYCENRLGEPIRATINIKTINGIAYDDFDKVNMQENSEGFDCFTIWASTLKDMGITHIESVELTHEVFSGESFANSQRVTEESELIRIEFE